MIGREEERGALETFAQAQGPGLGMVWGRRRVGKSYLLSEWVQRTGGFYYEAVRGSSGEALRDLGARVAEVTGAAAPLDLGSWDRALDVLLDEVASRHGRIIVLDEYPYLREHTPALDSLIQRAFGPDRLRRTPHDARLVLCGSAISVMRGMLGGTAPLRGRSSLDLRISSFDFRTARELHGLPEHATALRTFAVIGGVAAYAREMVASDLPRDDRDFSRWIHDWVLSPSAPLFSEVPLLLSEDPSTAQARKLNLYHAVLAGVATGHHAHSKLTRYVKIRGASLSPILEALVSAELIDRVQDALRENRPTYHAADPLIRFHYAVIRRYGTILSRPGTRASDIWSRVRPTFEAQVLGPCFEGLAREWTLRHAGSSTLGGIPDRVGPTELILPDGSNAELDVVAVQESEPARVLAIGEAKVGERLNGQHLARLEAARSALGARAAGARLLLFGSRFTPALERTAESRSDVELVDLERLYEGT